MRVSVAPFFSSGTGALVGEDPEDVILNCYRLADRYHQSPEHFLEMPLSRISSHLHYTVRLIEAQQRARRAMENERVA